MCSVIMLVIKNFRKRWKYHGQASIYIYCKFTIYRLTKLEFDPLHSWLLVYKILIGEETSFFLS